VQEGVIDFRSGGIDTDTLDEIIVIHGHELPAPYEHEYVDGCMGIEDEWTRIVIYVEQVLGESLS
jgi:hypothetical protein